MFDTAFRGDLGNVGTETISDIERMESLMRDRESGLPAGVGEDLDLVGTGESDTTATDTTASDTTASDTTAAGAAATGAEPAESPAGQ